MPNFELWHSCRKWATCTLIILFIPPTISPGPTKQLLLAKSFKTFILTPKSLALEYFPLELGCLLQSPAMRSNAGMANRQGDVDLCFVQIYAPQLALWLGFTWVLWPNVVPCSVCGADTTEGQRRERGKEVEGRERELLWGKMAPGYVGCSHIWL